VAQPGLIDDYLAQLAGRLPAAIVAELADGLHETYLTYRHAGLPDEQAAGHAVAEFGDPNTVIAGFLAANPARRTARILLLTGPVVGAAWAAAVLMLHTWNWPVPVAARIGFGTTLITGIGLLAIAAFAQQYRRATRNAAAACLVVLAVDATMLGYLGAAGLLTTWPAVLAAPLSATRSIYTLSRLPTFRTAG
jgi:hypothetical protein